MFGSGCESGAGELCVCGGGRRGGVQSEVRHVPRYRWQRSTGMGKNMGLKSLSSPEVQKMSDADLTALVTNGKGKMPGYKDKLSDDEISAVVKYVKTLK